MDKIIAGWSIQTEGDTRKIVFDTNDKKLFDNVLMVCIVAVESALARNAAAENGPLELKAKQEKGEDEN